MNAKNTITLPFSEILRIKNACNLNEDPEKEKKIKEVTFFLLFFIFTEIEIGIKWQIEGKSQKLAEHTWGQAEKERWGPVWKIQRGWSN